MKGPFLPLCSRIVGLAAYIFWIEHDRNDDEQEEQNERPRSTQGPNIISNYNRYRYVEFNPALRNLIKQLKSGSKMQVKYGIS